jgi:cytochrome c-type biogenesis protein CcmH
MNSALFLFLPAALFGAAAFWWVARAYGRAGGEAKPAVIGICVALIAATGLYLTIGRPALPDEPFAQRLAALMNKNPTEMTANELLAVLDERARIDKDDARPLIFSGEILTQLGRPELAIGKFQAALAREPNAAGALIGIGRARVVMDQGQVSDAALKIFQQARVLTPDDPIPWLYLALGASQAEAFADAAALWPEVLKRLPADDPRRPMGQQMLAEARAKTAQRR